jgi:hypothetical protein
MQAEEPVMAAYGGEMHGYAGGGAVAFDRGGNPEIEQILKKSPMMRTPEENEKLRAAGIGLERRQPAPEGSGVDTANRYLRGIFGDPSPVSYSSGIDEVLAAEKGRKPTAMTSQQMEAAMQSAPAAAPRPPGATRPGAGPSRPQRQPTATPGTEIASVNPYRGLTFNPDTAVGPEVTQRTGLAALEAADVEAAQKRMTQDPTVKAAQDALLQNMQGTADTRRTRAQQQLDEVLKRGRTSVFEDPEALLRIAAGIDTRRGRGIGSLAGGISSVMGERRKEAADARTLFNKEMDALDTMKQLQLERDLLIKQGRITEAQAAEDKLRAVRKDYEGIRYNREVKQTEEARQQFIAESGRMSATAAQTKAEAAMKSANARVAGAGERGAITQRDLAKYRMDAEKQVEKLLPEDREFRKLRNDPTAQAAHRENLIKAKVREALLAAGFEPPAGYEKPTTAAPATNDPLGIRKP